MNAREALDEALARGVANDHLRRLLLDNYRSEALAKAVGRLRSIPVTCTALVGPVWYGDGWKSAITCLEEIADYQTPDDEAYPGEMEGLRALVLNLRAAARKADLEQVQRLIVDHRIFELDAREREMKSGAAPGFFRPGRTYTAVAQPFTFHCVTHTVWPDGSVRALGRSAWTERAELHWIATEFAVEDWTGGAWGGWTDVTEGVAS